MPTYIPTATLSASYEQEFSSRVVNTFVPARPAHQALFDDESLYRRIYSIHGRTQTIRNTIDGCNIALSSMTMLYSEVDPEEGLPARLRQLKLPVIHQADNYHVSFSARDLYGDDIYTIPGVRAGTRCISFNDQLHRHFNLAALRFPVAQLPPQENTSLQKNIDLAVKKGNFQFVLHHSEQAFMRSFASQNNIDEILNALSDYNAAIFGGIVLDLFTTRLMCNNCAYHLIGFSDIIMPTIAQAIHRDRELRVTCPDNNALLFHARVSARDACNTNDGSTIQAAHDRSSHQYHHNERMTTLQTTASKMRLTEYTGNRFKTSSDFYLSGKIREDNIDSEIIDNRYNGLRR